MEGETANKTMSTVALHFFKAAENIKKDNQLGFDIYIYIYIYLFLFLDYANVHLS